MLIHGVIVYDLVILYYTKKIISVIICTHIRIKIIKMIVNGCILKEGIIITIMYSKNNFNKRGALM